MHYKEVKAILSPQNGLNLYRGGANGFIYVNPHGKTKDAPDDYLDIEVKANAVSLLENTLKKKRRKGMISTGGITDPYIALESELKLMRKCLMQIERYEFGIDIQTRSDLILRDIDVLENINKKTKCVVTVNMTTLDDSLCEKLEEGYPATSKRFEILQEMKKRKIPTIVYITPILPHINDSLENMKGILDLCVQSDVYGIMYNGAGLSVKGNDREYFFEQLGRLFPELVSVYEKEFGDANDMQSENADALNKLVYSTCESNGIIYDRNDLQRYMREYKNNTGGEQLTMFDFDI